MQQLNVEQIETKRLLLKDLHLQILFLRLRITQMRK